MEVDMWYAYLVKPAWAPPAWVFGPVWMVLYVGIAISFGAVLYYAARHKKARSLAIPFALNLAANFAFMPIQFGLKNNALAALDIVLVVATLVWGMRAVWRKAPKLRWVVFTNIPYLVWVLFATTLQFAITIMNIGR